MLDRRKLLIITVVWSLLMALALGLLTMKTRRKDCVLASKVWYKLDYQGVIDSVHASLNRLQTDHIDILQIHGRMYTPAEVEHVLHGGPLDALLELRAAGAIGHIGITSEEPWTVIPFLAHEAIEVYQIAYNIIYQAAARHFLIEAGKANAGVVTMRTMTSGIFQCEMSLLAPEWQAAHDLYEVALKFVLSDIHHRHHHQVPRLLEPQRLLVLHRAHRRDRLEMLVKRRKTHVHQS